MSIFDYAFWEVAGYAVTALLGALFVTGVVMVSVQVRRYVRGRNV